MYEIKFIEFQHHQKEPTAAQYLFTIRKCVRFQLTVSMFELNARSRRIVNIRMLVTQTRVRIYR